MIWYLVLVLTGSGKALAVIPEPYVTYHQCREAAQHYQARHGEWYCVPRTGDALEQIPQAVRR